MAVYTDTLEVVFSPVYTGQTGNVNYKVTDSTGAVQVVLTNVGVAEKANAPGTYYVRGVSLNDGWLPAEVDWSITGQAGVGATEVLKNVPKVLGDVGGNLEGAVTGLVNVNMTQAVPLSNTAQTVGDALNAARAQGFGRWVQSGTSFVLYGGDGTTVVRTFTLDSATAPQSRS